MDIDDIQHSLHRLANAAWRIDTRGFEIAPPTRVCAELCPALLEVMTDAIALLGCVLARYDAPQATEAPDESGVFNCMFDDIVADIRPSDPRVQIADIAFMARWEIERKQAGILAATQAADERVIGLCCSARRRVIKATSGVERVLSEVERLPSVFVSLYQTEQLRAIETRSAYYIFADCVRTAALFYQDHDLQRCLRLIGAGLAQLVGRAIYEELRIEDRRSLRSLQARLVEWLRGHQDALEGRRLVSEIDAFTSLLMEVNRRAVLIEHDCAVLDKLIAALAQPATNWVRFHPLLVTLRGRAAELDRLIAGRAELRAELWLGIAHATLAGLRMEGSGARRG